MKTRILMIVAGALSALAISGCNIPEPAAPCLIGRADNFPYVVHYKLTSGTDCLNYAAAHPYIGDAPQPMDGSYEVYNMEKYGPPGGTVKDIAIFPFAFAGTWGDPDATTVAPQDPTPGHDPLIQGALDGFTVDANGHCSAKDLNTAEQDISQNPSGAVTYHLHDVVWLADPAHQGGQFGATLDYTDGTCTATYTVLGLYPVAFCGGFEADGVTPKTQAEADADCSAVPNVAAGRVSGSGLQPDYPVHCNYDPTSGSASDVFLFDWSNYYYGDGRGICVFNGDTFPQLCSNCNAQ